MSVTDLINLLDVEKPNITITPIPEETSLTNSITTDTLEAKTPKITPRAIKEKVDSHDENSEPEAEDEVIQYLNEK